jgi:monoamine oxidase
MSLRIINRSVVPTLAELDILVVRAGSAGYVAALAARKANIHSVILLERYRFVGGTSTQILDTFYRFFTLGDQPRKNIGARNIESTTLRPLLKKWGSILETPDNIANTSEDGWKTNPQRLSQ